MADVPGAGSSFPYVSYLRVYEPLDAFSDAQQLAILEQRTRGRRVTEQLERIDAVRRITRAVSDPFPHHAQDLVRVLHFPRSNGTTAPYYAPISWRYAPTCPLSPSSRPSAVR